MQSTYHILLISLLKGPQPCDGYSGRKFTLKSSTEGNATKVMQQNFLNLTIGQSQIAEFKKPKGRWLWPLTLAMWTMARNTNEDEWVCVSNLVLRHDTCQACYFWFLHLCSRNDRDTYLLSYTSRLRRLLKTISILSTFSLCVLHSPVHCSSFSCLCQS